jgi:hypothetical protein
MYQKDYILRMIEMLGDLLRAIFGMITRGNYQQASRSINEAYLTMLRKDAAFFQNIPAGELTTTLINDHHYTNAHLEVLAELLYAEATLLYEKKNKQESLPYYQKSILLFEFIEKTDRTFSEERQDRMRVIRDRITGIGENITSRDA